MCVCVKGTEIESKRSEKYGIQCSKEKERETHIDT